LFAAARRGFAYFGAGDVSAGKGVAMFAKKTLAWIAAGLFSAAVAIPAIGSTVAKKHTKHVTTHKAVHHGKVATHKIAHHKPMHHKTAGKTVSHKKITSKKSKASSKKTVLAAHSAHRKTAVHAVVAKHKISAKHKTTAAHNTHAVRASYGISSMHSGKSNALVHAAPKTAARKNVVLAKSTKIQPKKTVSHGTLLSAVKTFKTGK
jgi:hypothetical protein